MIHSVTDLAAHMTEMVASHLTFEGIFLLHPIRQDGTVDLSRFEEPALELLQRMISEPHLFTHEPSVAIGVAVHQGLNRMVCVVTVDDTVLTFDRDHGVCACELNHVDPTSDEGTQLIAICDRALRAIRQALAVTQVSLN